MKIKSLKQVAISFGVMLTALVVFNALGVAPVLANIGVTDNDLPSFLAGSERDARSLVKTLLNYALGFLGLVAVGFIIYAGFLYVTSGTNEENTGKAKNIIVYAIIGIVVILASAAIVNFALDSTQVAAPTPGGGTL